jgi:curved DNA-binding protein
MSHYDTLGIDKTASQDDIKKAYRRLAKEYHPDINGGDDSRFKKIAEAYEVLGDSNKRQQYDNGGQGFFNNFGGGSGPDLSDLFNQFFGNAYGQRTPQRGSDVQLEIQVTFEEAYKGTSRKIEFNGEVIQMNFKPGLKSGQKFRVKEKGHPHPYNSTLPKGDLIAMIHVLADPRFILQGDDIWIETTIPWYDIMLGTSIAVMSPTGMLSIKVPKGTTPGKTLRVQDKGFPVYGSTKKGALMCKINAFYPELTEDQLEYIKQIKQVRENGV